MNITTDSSSISKEVELVIRILSKKFHFDYEEAINVIIVSLGQEELSRDQSAVEPVEPVEPVVALEALEASDKQKDLFDFIANQVQTNIQAERIESYKTSKGDTQKTERDVINDIKSILDTNKIVYTEAGSQQSKDFRNVGNIGLNIEIKKTDSNCIYFNDTCPSKSIFYIIFFTGKKTKKQTIHPQAICINGHEMVKDSPWVYEYQLKLEQLKNQYARGTNKKELSGIMSVYPRPTYKADINSFLKKELLCQKSTLPKATQSKATQSKENLSDADKNDSKT